MHHQHHKEKAQAVTIDGDGDGAGGDGDHGGGGGAGGGGRYGPNTGGRLYLDASGESEERMSDQTRAQSKREERKRKEMKAMRQGGASLTAFRLSKVSLQGNTLSFVSVTLGSFVCLVCYCTVYCIC